MGRIRDDRQKYLPRPLESSIQRTGISCLRLLGIILLRRNVALVKSTYKGKTRVFRAGERGQADTYGWICRSGFSNPGLIGKHVEIEWKRPGQRPSREQLNWLKRCTEDGTIAFWVDNVDTAERVVRAILNGGKIVWRDGDSFDVEMI